MNTPAGRRGGQPSPTSFADSRGVEAGGDLGPCCDARGVVILTLENGAADRAFGGVVSRGA